MISYFIDGNNLICKHSHLAKLQKEKKTESRVQLINILHRYFRDKKQKILVFFDGFENESLVLPKINIMYSNKLTADEVIRREIDNFKNPKKIVLITSDLELIRYARVNSCGVIKTEEFLKSMEEVRKDNEEKAKVITDEEMKRLLGIE